MSEKRVNLISGPRNLSTALMYSFGNRSDTEIIDEPMYAYYLSRSGVETHPGIAEIMESLPRDLEEVKKLLFFKPIAKPVYFIKGMAHHYYNLDYSFILDFENVFLIRDPKQLIASFAQVVKQPSIHDIGLKDSYDIFCFLKSCGSLPIVLDSGELLKNPSVVLHELCKLLDIPFEEAMLSWNPGPRPEDGVWAKYWYQNVWKTTSFVAQSTSSRSLPENLSALYEEAMSYYSELYEFSIKSK